MERCSVWDGIWIERGTMADYEALAEFHYRGGRPGGVMRVWVARYAGKTKEDGAGEAMRAGVLVECLPALACTLRNVALSGRYAGMGRSLAAAKLNREVRTISRVVVHPMFRATGLAAELVRRALEEAETPFVEALAAMGRVNRFFERAGMTAYERPMGAEGVRLVAALRAELKTKDERQKTKGDAAVVEFLAGLRAEEVSPFLAGELRRFARGKDGGVAEWLAAARGRLFSWPVYFLWKGESRQE